MRTGSGCVFAVLSFVLARFSTQSARAEKVSPPVISITAPGKKKPAFTGPYSVSGTYHAAGGIEAIHCGNAATKTGDFKWSPAVTNTSKTWSASIDLLLGSNVVAAYAVDLLGHSSKTNYITIDAGQLVLAPGSLDGTAAQMVLSDGVPYEISFGASTFVQQSTDTNHPSGVGNYTYTVTSTNTAQIFLDYIAPAEMAGVTNVLDITFAMGDPVLVTFATSSGDTGTMETGFPLATNLAPSSLTGMTYDFGNSNTVAYSDGVFTNNSPTSTNALGAYTYTKFSPCGGLISMRSIQGASLGESNDLVVTFASSKAGNYFSSAFDSSEVAVGVGEFTNTAVHKEGAQFAPASLAGFQIRMTPENELPFQPKHPYTVDFGEATFGITSLAYEPSGVGNYAYLRSGPKSAQVSFSYVYPPLEAGSGGVWDLLFTTSQGGSFFNTNGFEAGKFTVTPTKDLLPATLDGKTVLIPAGAHANTISFFEGMFTEAFYIGLNNGLPAIGEMGTYSCFPTGNHTAMVIMTQTNPSPAVPVYLQLDFATSTSGVGINTYDLASTNEVITINAFKLK